MNGGTSPQSKDAATADRLSRALNLSYALVLVLFLAFVVTLAYLLLSPGEAPQATHPEENASIGESTPIVDFDQPTPHGVNPHPPSRAPVNQPVNHPQIAPGVINSTHPVPHRYLSPHRLVKPGDPFGKDLASTESDSVEWNTNVIIRIKIVDVPSDIEVALSPVDLKSLNQLTGVDILSAPTVAARPGQPARIEIIRELMSPKPGAGNTEFDTLPLGITINLVATPPQDLAPSASLSEAAGRPMTIEAVLTINEFAGFIDADPATGFEGTPTAHQSQLERTLVLEPGDEYHGVAGFLREDVTFSEDVVPILGELPYLGELFRSSIETTRQRRSYLLISFDWIDEAGNTAPAPGE